MAPGVPAGGGAWDELFPDPQGGGEGLRSGSIKSNCEKIAVP